MHSFALNGQSCSHDPKCIVSITCSFNSSILWAIKLWVAQQSMITTTSLFSMNKDFNYYSLSCFRGWKPRLSLEKALLQPPLSLLAALQWSPHLLDPVKKFYFITFPTMNILVLLNSFALLWWCTKNFSSQQKHKPLSLLFSKSASDSWTFPSIHCCHHFCLGYSTCVRVIYTFCLFPCFRYNCFRVFEVGWAGPFYLFFFMGLFFILDSLSFFFTSSGFMISQRSLSTPVRPWLLDYLT